MFTLNGTTPVPKIDFAARTPFVTGPSEGYFQFDQTGISHGFLLDPSQPANLALGQTQMLCFLGVTGHTLVVDPTHMPLPGITAIPSIYKPIQVPQRYTILGQ